MPVLIKVNDLWLGFQGDTGDSLMIERTMPESTRPLSE